MPDKWAVWSCSQSETSIWYSNDFLLNSSRAMANCFDQNGGMSGADFSFSVQIFIFNPCYMYNQNNGSGHNSFSPYHWKRLVILFDEFDRSAKYRPDVAKWVHASPRHQHRIVPAPGMRACHTSRDKCARSAHLTRIPAARILRTLCINLWHPFLARIHVEWWRPSLCREIATSVSTFINWSWGG
jgi:hypothetical protein